LIGLHMTQGVKIVQRIQRQERKDAETKKTVDILSLSLTLTLSQTQNLTLTLTHRFIKARLSSTTEVTLCS
jgi:hypothetical protein